MGNGCSSKVIPRNSHESNLEESVSEIQREVQNHGVMIEYLQTSYHKISYELEKLNNNLEHHTNRVRSRPSSGKSSLRGSMTHIAESMEIDRLKNGIKSRFTELRDHLTLDLNEHLDYLMQEGVLSLSEYQFIRAQQTELEKSRQLLLKIMTKRNEHHLNVFVRSLEQHNNTRHLAEELYEESELSDED